MKCGVCGSHNTVTRAVPCNDVVCMNCGCFYPFSVGCWLRHKNEGSSYWSKEKYIMEWSKPQKATAEVWYDHITAITPLGKIIIDWKGWKEDPQYDISLKFIAGYGDYTGEYRIGNTYDLEEAKEKAEDWLREKSKELQEYLKGEADAK